MKKISFLLLIYLWIAGSVQAKVENGDLNNSREILYNESFDYSPGQVPPGWTIDSADAHWLIYDLAMAGGEAPELGITQNFAHGSIHMVSPVINIEGYSKLCLRLKQYLINAERDYGEIIGLDMTFDGGQNWEVLWEKYIGLLNIPQDEYAFYFNAPEGAVEFQFQFRFEGNTQAINWWVMDDIILESVAENDLLIPAYAFFDVDPAPKAGEESLCFVEVMNGGSEMQSNYTVRLMQEDGTELVSVAGEPIAFAEKKFFMMFWTPTEDMIGNTITTYFEIDFQADQKPENNRSGKKIINVQAPGNSYLDISTGSWPLIDLPFNFMSLYSLTQTIYYTEEIDTSDIIISGLQYSCQFDQEADVPLQIYMGETSMNNLSEDWVNPSTLTKVFEGTLTFTKGFNSFFIPLDQAYAYQNGNLVIHATKSYPQMLIGTPFINTLDTNSMRSRISTRDDQPFDPEILPEFSYASDYYPNLRLFYSSNITSVSNSKAETNSLLLYPNPTTHLLNIEGKNDIQEVRIINTLGQLVLQHRGKGNRQQIDLSEVNDGIYLVQIFSKGSIHIEKIQIKRN